jgi:hypothetical protein
MSSPLQQIQPSQPSHEPFDSQSQVPLTVKLRRPGGRFLVGSGVRDPKEGWRVELPAGVQFEPGDAVELALCDASVASIRSEDLCWARVTQSLAFRDAVHVSLRLDAETDSHYSKAG